MACEAIVAHFVRAFNEFAEPPIPKDVAVPIVRRIHSRAKSLYAGCVSEIDRLTTDQVMDRLLSRRALRRAAVTCVLPAVRVGTEWRFRREDLEAWIASQTGTAEPDAAAAKG